MTWQKVVGYIHDTRIRVESKSGKQYPVECDEQTGEMVYKNGVNSAHDRTLWAWVEFPDEGGPRTEWAQTGSPYGGPPESPPGQQ